MSLLRKYKICKIFNDFSSLTEHENEIIWQLNHWFPTKKLYKNGILIINNESAYCYKPENKELYFNKNLIYTFSHKSLTEVQTLNLIKDWFVYHFKIEIITVIPSRLLHNGLNIGTYHIKID